MRVSGDNLKIEIKGRQVNYDDNGPQYAPAIIFVHGFPFTKSVWSLQAELFKTNYRVIAYDVRGHGGSIAGAEMPSLDLFAEDLIDLMDALEIDKAIVCGLSMGGYIALNAVGRFPGRFNALVLSATKCPADTDEVVSQRMAAIELIKEKGLEFYVDDTLKKLFAPVSFTTRREEVRATRRMMLVNDPENVCDTLRALAERRETCTELPLIKVPALIVVGKDDKITPPSDAQFLNERISGSQLEIIDYAAHLANLENTHDYNRALRKFIDQVCEAKQLSPHCSEHK